MKNRPYNGYKNWNHWNVSLWLNNVEPDYFNMISYIKKFPNKNAAAKALFEDFYCGKSTPDGAKYSISSIRQAMVGINK